MLLASIATGSAMALTASAVKAADVDYQGGGGGVWDNSTTNWVDINGGTSWNSNAGNGALFQFGNSGTVNLNENISTSSLDFTTDGYKIAGPGALTFVNGASSLQDITYNGSYSSLTNAAVTMRGLIEVTAASTTVINTAEIDSNINSTVGLLKVGNGTLILGGTNNITGNYALTVGTADVVIGGYLPTQAAATNQGGTLKLASASALAPTTRVDIGSGYLDIGAFNQTLGALTFTTQNPNGFNAQGQTGQSAAALSLTNGVIGTGTLKVTGDITALPYVGVLFGSSYQNGIGTNLDLGNKTQAIKTASGNHDLGLVFTGSISNGAVSLTGLNGAASDGLSFFGNNTYTGPTLFYGGQEKLAGSNLTTSLKQYTGATTLLGTGGTLQGATDIKLLAGAFLILDSVNNNFNTLSPTNIASNSASFDYVPAGDNAARLNPSAAITMRDGQLQLRSQVNGATSTTVASLTTTAGNNVVLLAPSNFWNSAGGATATITVTGNLSIDPSSTLMINTPSSSAGPNLLGGSAKFFVNGTLPTADATGIIPNVFGTAGFLTYNATTGLTPYTGYASDFSTAGTNVLTTSNITVPNTVSINSLNLGGVAPGLNFDGFKNSGNGSTGGIYTVTIPTGKVLTVASGMVVNTFNNYNASTSFAIATVNISGGTLDFGSKRGLLYGSTPAFWIGTNTSSGSSSFGATNAYSTINLANYTNITSAITGSNGLLVSGPSGSGGGYTTLNGDLSGLTGPITVANGQLVINNGGFTGDYYVHTGTLTFQANQSSGTGTVYLGDASGDSNMAGTTAALDLGTSALKTATSTGGGGGLGNTNSALAPLIFTPNIVVDNGLKTLNGVPLNESNYSYFAQLQCLYTGANAIQTIASNITLNTPLWVVEGTTPSVTATGAVVFAGNVSGSSLMYLKSGRYVFGPTSNIVNTGGLAIGASGNTGQATFNGSASTSEPFNLFAGNNSYFRYSGPTAITSGPITMSGPIGNGINAFTIAPTVTGTTLNNQFNIIGDLTYNASTGVQGTWAGKITGSGNLYSNGTGRLDITGTTNTFSGILNVSSGTIVVNANNLSPSKVIVGSLGTLGANGTITWPLSLQGTLYPGLANPTIPVSTSILASSNLSGGTLKLDLTGPSTSDIIAFAGGSPTLTGVTLALFNAGAGTFTSGETFQLFNFSAGAPIGTFLSPLTAVLPALPSGLDWNAANLYTAGTISIGTSSSDTWNNPSSESWETGANWLGGNVPGGTGTTVNFGDVIGTGSATVTLSAETVGTVNFNGTQGGSYTIAGTSLGLFTATGPSLITTTTGTQSITAPIGYSGNLNINTASGSALVLGNIGTASNTGTLTINGTGTTIAGTATIPGNLNISTGSSLALTGTGSVLGKLSLPTGSALNIGSTAVVYTNTPINLSGGTINVAGNFSTGSNTTAQNLASTIVLTTGSTINVSSGGLLANYALWQVSSGATVNVASGANLAGQQSKNFNISSGGNLNIATGGKLGIPSVLGASSTVVGNVINIQGNATWAPATSGTAPVINYLQGLKLLAGGKATFQSTTVPAARMLTVGGFGGNALSATVGLVDLGNNDMAFIGTYTGSSGLTNLTSFIKAGYAGGTWNGATGITSSAAAADPTHLHALGVIINDTNQNFNSTSGSILYSNFDGYNSSVYGQSSANPMSKSATLIKYTYYGDANLDGKVDGSDYSLIDSGFLIHRTGWYNGDFNYDGIVNGSDYTLMDNAYNTQGAQIASAIASPTAQISASGGSSVPEPTSLGLIVIASAGLLGRRKRN